MLENIIIRNAFDEDDMKFIKKFHAASYKKEYNYGIEFEKYVNEGIDEFIEHFNHGTNRVWICEDNKRIIGCLFFVDRNDSAQLRYFLIHPEYRRSGLGKKLMKLFMKYYNENNYKSCYLWTTNEQTKASELYKKFGFRLAEEKESNKFGKLLIEQKFVFTQRVEASGNLNSRYPIKKNLS